jgi:hypothetical protein
VPVQVPTGLAFTAIATDGATLTWNSAVGAKYYEIDIAEDSSFSSERMVTTSATSNTTSYTFTGMPAGTALYARVRAQGDGGRTANSSSANGTLTAFYTPDTTNLLFAWDWTSAVSGAVSTMQDWGPAGLNASWPSTIPATGTQPDGFQFYIPTPSTSWGFSTARKVSLTTTASISYILHGSFNRAPSGTEYFLSDNGTLVLGMDSSNRARVRRPGVTNTAKYYTIGAGTPNANSFVARIGAGSPGVSSYRWGNTDIALTIDQDTGSDSYDNYMTLGNCGGYGVVESTRITRVWMFNRWITDAEVASAANWRMAVPAPTLAAITTVTTNSFVASWTHIPGAISYRVDVSTQSNFASLISGYNSKIVATSSCTGLTVSGLTADTTYYVRARSVGLSGIGPNSTSGRGVTAPTSGVPQNGLVLELLPVNFTNWDGASATWRNTGSYGTTGNFTVSNLAWIAVSSGTTVSIGEDTRLAASSIVVPSPEYTIIVKSVNQTGSSVDFIWNTAGSLDMVRRLGDGKMYSFFHPGYLGGSYNYNLDGTEQTFVHVWNGTLADNNSRMEMWRSGVKQTTVYNGTIPSTCSITGLQIGNGYYDCRGIRMYSRALSAAEIASTTLWTW